MYVCLLDQRGEMLLHSTMKTSPDALLKAIAHYRDQIVVAAEWMFTWYWRADWCAAEGISFGLGPARSMKAIHGGQAKHDTIDAQKMAVLRRGGMRPQASGDPAALRATCALLRRRMHLAHTRGERLAHVQHTNSQYTLPAIGKTIASKATRDGVAERFADPAVPKRIEGDLSRIDDDAHLLRDVELSILKAAQHHDANPLDRLRRVPGIGKSLSRMLWYEIHDIDRFPRVQEVASDCRLVKCAKESAGKRSGTSGANIGHAHLKWACSEAAVLCLRDNPAGPKFLVNLETKHSPRKAWTILAHQLARAVDDMLQRKTALTTHRFFNDLRRGVDELDASLDNHRMNLS